MPRKMHEVGETFTTPRSLRTFTCIAHVEHVRRDGRTVLVPLWQIACIRCHAPWRHMRYRPKLVTCQTCLAGYRPESATAVRIEHNRRVWQDRMAQERLAKGSSQVTRASEQGPQKPARRPRKPAPWLVPDEPNTAVSNPIAGLFTD
jgi:hypothetical protein